MTWPKLLKLIKAGYGQGHFDTYKPWLHITRKTSSPVSNIGLLPAPDLGRTHHYLAAAERTTILLLKWLGAFDVREQYPVWPWSHRHPLEGLPSLGTHDHIPGLLSIAKDLGIDHGVFWGTTIPYIATIDVLSTWQEADGTLKLLATECKPEDVLHGSKSSKRIKERLAITGQYCVQANIPRHIFHAECLPAELAVNLDALFPRMSRASIAERRHSDTYRRLVDSLGQRGQTSTPQEVARSVASKTGVSTSEVLDMLHLTIWTQDIDHDITAPLELFSPLIPGGQTLRARLKAAMRRESA